MKLIIIEVLRASQLVLRSIALCMLNCILHAGRIAELMQQSCHTGDLVRQKALHGQLSFAGRSVRWTWQ